MPAVSRKQQRFAALCFTHPEAAHGKCMPRKVAKEFMHMKKKKTKKRRGY